MIERNEYVNKLISYKDTDLIKVITGMRRTGKSKILELYILYLKAHGVPKERIIHMNLGSMSYRKLNNFEDFFDYVAERINTNEKYYVLFDEVQEIDGWEKAVESMRIDYDVDVYVTGSNAYLLSSELSTLLSGRYVEIKVYPLSFKEFLDFHQFEDEVTTEQKFQEYVRVGGMPILHEFPLNSENIFTVLEGIYSTVIVRDVLERAQVESQATLEKIVRFLADNIGNVSSLNNIANVLRNESKTRSPANRTVEKQIEMVEKAYIFYPLKRYDVKGKEYLKTLEKHYIVDIGIRNMLLGVRAVDRGHVLENIVFLELMRKGYKLSIGKIDTYEIDFIAEKNDIKKYIQVTETMLSDEVRKRELRPLKLINDNYEKIILSMDRDIVRTEDGIQIVNILDFLLEDDE